MSRPGQDYTMDWDDLLGEINVVHRVIGDAVEYLDAGDPAAARTVLRSWVDHGDGHPEIESNRKAYECRVCQAPETKITHAKMDRVFQEATDGQATQ
jgi:hypothetical protein